MYEPFNGRFHLKAGRGGSTSIRRLKEVDIEKFYEEALIAANQAVSDRGSTSAMAHYVYNSPNTLDRAIENMFHLVECRNIILWVMQSVEAMEKASYCGDFISILVIDKAGHNVARLLPIQCHKIRQLATAFEDCLSQVIGLHRFTTFLDTEMTFAKELSKVCQELLSGLGLNVPVAHRTELWRCAVHVLDVAVLSYAGAHTQFFSTTGFKCFTLPGPFLEKQHFMFRRRSFLCLDGFLGGKQAWVLEWYHPDVSQINLPPLYLSADATTFADIWGPMWKVCALRNGQVDNDHILQYNIGNGVILPWSLPSSDSQSSISCRKNEVLCHWVSDKGSGEMGDVVGSSGVHLQPNDVLLIGASAKLNYNPRCNLSTDKLKQRLRDANSLFELGTMKNTRILDSEAVQIQIGPSYVKGSAQRTYKRRGVTWKEAWTEAWRNNPESRNIRLLEFKFGVEVSACTYNARRRRLISLFGSKTMMNHLRNGALTWNNLGCEESFYAALESPDYKAFRKLYLSEKNWQFDLGKAITHCLDALTQTGTNEGGLNLHWVPNSEPGHNVNLRLREHSWIGFLKDTETCCTMAILENNCLELPDLIQARKCQNSENDAGSAIGPSSDQLLSSSVFETSFMLHQNSVPKLMRPKPCHGHNSSVSNHKHVWSTSSLEAGEKFHFGENGQLVFIKSLGNGQILATWKHSQEILQAVKEKIQGERRHREYIRTEKGGAGPVYVLIMSSEPEMTMTSSFAASESSVNPAHIRRYTWIPTKMAGPRSMRGSMSDEMRQIMDRWRRGELASVDSRDSDALKEIIADLVAALPSDSKMDRGIGQRNN